MSRSMNLEGFNQQYVDAPSILIHAIPGGEMCSGIS
jgi:hypothetical protein